MSSSSSSTATAKGKKHKLDRSSEKDDKQIHDYWQNDDHNDGDVFSHATRGEEHIVDHDLRDTEGGFPSEPHSSSSSSSVSKKTKKHKPENDESRLISKTRTIPKVVRPARKGTIKKKDVVITASPSEASKKLEEKEIDIGPDYEKICQIIESLKEDSERTDGRTDVLTTGVISLMDDLETLLNTGSELIQQEVRAAVSEYEIVNILRSYQNPKTPTVQDDEIPPPLDRTEIKRSETEDSTAKLSKRAGSLLEKYFAQEMSMMHNDVPSDHEDDNDDDDAETKEISTSSSDARKMSNARTSSSSSSASGGKMYNIEDDVLSPPVMSGDDPTATDISPDENLVHVYGEDMIDEPRTSFLS